MSPLFSSASTPRPAVNLTYWVDILTKLTPIRVAEMLFKIAPLIPYYHLVSNERVIHVCHIYPYKSESQFKNDVDFLCGRYHPISIADLVDYVRHGKEIKNGSFILTFDDGYSEMYSVVAPILYHKGIPAIFFLSTDFIDNKTLFYKNKASILIESILRNSKRFIEAEQKLPNNLNSPSYELCERILSIQYKDAKALDSIADSLGINFNVYLKEKKPYLSSAQIRKMIEMGFNIGAHSIDHPLYSELSLEDQLNQTISSLQYIKENFGLPYSIFAFPHSDRNVSMEFFCEIENYADLTFGAGDIKKESPLSHLERTNFEKTLRPAKRILTHQFISRRVHKWIQMAKLEKRQ